MPINNQIKTLGWSSNDKNEVTETELETEQNEYMNADTEEDVPKTIDKVEDDTVIDTEKAKNKTIKIITEENTEYQ